MKLDLLKLNNYNHLDIDTDIVVPPEYYEKMDIRDIKDLHVTGRLDINLDDEILANLEVRGTFILPCAITLDDVPYPFVTKIEEILGSFDDFFNKNKNTLDILPVIWENIVSEVPIRVVKEGVKNVNLHGDGWEYASSE